MPFNRQCKMCGWYSDQAPNIQQDQDELHRSEQLRKSYNDRYLAWKVAKKGLEIEVDEFERKAKHENNKFKLRVFHRETYRAVASDESVTLYRDGEGIDAYTMKAKKPDVWMSIPRYIECEVCGHRNYIDPVNVRLDGGR